MQLICNVKSNITTYTFNTEKSKGGYDSSGSPSAFNRHASLSLNIWGPSPTWDMYILRRDNTRESEPMDYLYGYRYMYLG